MKKNILAFQFGSKIGDPRANYSKVESLFDNFYKNLSNDSILPDIVVLPEVWTTGWYCEIFKDKADYSNETETFLLNLSKKYNVNIIGGSYIRATEDGFKNTCPVVRRGEKDVVARYEKIHLYAPDGEAVYVKEGKTPVIVDIEGLKIGLSICYDIRFPELFRSYINSPFPPELMINMSAWPLTRKEQYSIMAASRAIENQCYFLALSQTGKITDDVYNAGNSIFVDSMGRTVKKLDENEGCIFETVDTNLVNSTRTTYPNLSARKVLNFGFKPIMSGNTVNV